MTDEVYADITPSGKTLMHGFTSSGHPVACAVALCNIAIIEDEALADNASKMGAYLRGRLQEASEVANNVGEVRGVGLLAAVDINFAGRDIDHHALDAEVVAMDLRRRRVLLRRYGETLALAPALAVTEEDIDAIVGEISLSMRSARSN
jgi:4-aminobutyrate--pyruvate transaminase